MRSSILATLILAAATSPRAAPGAETKTRAVPLVFQRAVNLDTSNAALRLGGEFRQEGEGPISMEAEQASVLRFTAGKGQMRREEQASGGLCVAFVDHLEFHFEVRSPGAYTAWYRGRFPLKGNWNHTENMDGAHATNVTDSLGDPLDQWIWTKGPTYELAAGKHSWNLTPAGWCGGAGLDKVMLVRDPASAPTGLGEPTLPATAPREGQAFSEEVRPRNLVAWQALRLTEATGKGSVLVECSTDHGGTWATLPAGGDLSRVPPEKPLAFRLTLMADADGSSPYVSRAEVAQAVEDVPPVVLENGRVQLRFAGDTGALTGIRNGATRTEYMAPGMETPLFSFTAVRPEFNTVVEIGFGQAQLRGIARPSAGELRMSYALMDGALTAEVTVRLEGPLARFALTVTNRTPYNLAQVRLLPLQGLRIGDDCSDDYLCTPICTGAIVKYPAELEYPRRIYTDRPLAYPGMATMCWMDLWDEQGGGLYLACEDREYRLTELTFSNGTGEPRTDDVVRPIPPPRETGYVRSARPGTYVNLGFDKRLLIRRLSAPVRVPEVVLGIHTGDWHWGADRYRQWAEPWMRPDRREPDWFRDTEGWTDCHMIHLGGFVDLAKGRPKGGRQLTMQDPPFPVITMWAQMASCEAFWSTPVLHLLLGNEEEFREGIRKQHELGHRFMSYNLPRSINPTFNRAAKRVGIVPRSFYPDDQVPPVGFYPEVGLRGYDGNLRCPDGVMSEASVCMGATRWREYERHLILDKYVREYGNDGMYLDGAGLDDLGSQDCKNLNHGHEGYGEWTSQFLRWLAELRTETRKARPGALFAGEGMGDVYQRYLDVSLFYPDNGSQVYRYTCPWNTGIFMAGTSAVEGWPEGGLEFATVYGLKVAGMDSNYEADPAKFKRVMAFRERFTQFQSRARFVDDVGLRVSDPQVRAKLYVREEPGNRGALLAAYSEGPREGVTAAVDRQRVGALGSAWCCDLDGALKPLPVREEGGRYVFALPASALSAALLLERSEPFLRFDHIAPIVPGEAGRATVHVTNLEAAPISGELSLALPPGWGTEAAKFALKPGETGDLTLPIEVPAGTKCDVYDVYAVAREAGRTTRKCLPMGVCRPVQAELYYTRRDTLRLAMHNSSGRAVAGNCGFVAPAGVTAEPSEAPFRLDPGGDGELVFRLGKVESVKGIEHLKAVLTYGAYQTSAYEHLQPTVLNGGFEECAPGDGYPDYWNYRSPTEMYLRGVTFDTDTFVEGRQSLRLDPYFQEYANALTTTLIKLVPKTRYRFSASIRRTAHGNVCAHLFSMGPAEAAKRVDVYLGQRSEGPVGVWERFEAEFTSVGFDLPYTLVLSNWTKGAVTAWFDDVRIEEVEPR